MISLPKFTGFTENDLLFFIGRDEDKRIELKKRMKALRKSVLNRLPPNISGRLRFGRVGILHTEDWSCWGSISQYKKFQNYAHFTLSLSVDGFNLWLNAETVSAIDRLKRNLEKDPIGFFNLLNELVFFTFRLYEKAPSERLPRDWPWILLFETPCEFIDVPSMMFLYNKLKELKYPVFRVGWVFDVRSKDDRDVIFSEVLTERIIELMSELIPLHDFVNGI